jgi:hypothetical protein
MRLDALHLRPAQRPQRQVHQVDAQVHHAPAARLRGVVEPRLVRPIGVVERSDRPHAPAPAPRRAPARAMRDHAFRSGRTGRPPAAGRASRRRHHCSTSAAVRPSGFWQNTAAPASSAWIDCSACSALGVAITTPSSPERQHLVEPADHLRVRRERLGRRYALGRRIRHRGCLHRPAGEDRLHPVPADPADAKEPDARPAHKVTSAFRNPSGRSRVASSASPSRSSGYSWV